MLTTYWEHPACVKCAGCSQPIELTWSSSVDPAGTYHGNCYLTWKRSTQQ